MTKPVTISPSRASAAAQAEGVSATCVDYDFEAYGNGWQRWYRAAAPAITGWTFSRFEWRRKRVTPAGAVEYSDFSNTGNPFPPTGEGRYYPEAGTLSDLVVDYGSTIGTDTYTVEDIVAVYVREPTHLLIHDDTTGLLVYDETTGLLVADY